MNFYNCLPYKKIRQYIYVEERNSSENCEKQKEKKEPEIQESVKSEIPETEDTGSTSAIESKGFGQDQTEKGLETGPSVFDLEKRKELGVYDNKSYMLNYKLDIPVEKKDKEAFTFVVETEEPRRKKARKETNKTSNNSEKSRYLSYK